MGLASFTSLSLLAKLGEAGCWKVCHPCHPCNITYDVASNIGSNLASDFESNSRHF